jgi:hypothetical protein
MEELFRDAALEVLEQVKALRRGSSDRPLRV